MHHQNQLTHKQLNHLLNLLLNRLMLLDQLLNHFKGLYIKLHQPEDTPSLPLPYMLLVLLALLLDILLLMLVWLS